MRARTLGATAGLGLLLLAAVLASLALGDSNLPPRQVLAALAGRGDDLARTVVWDLRLPRTLVGLAVGPGWPPPGWPCRPSSATPWPAPGCWG